MKRKLIPILLVLMLLAGCAGEDAILEEETASEDYVDYFAEYVNDGANIMNGASLTFGFEYEEGTEPDFVYKGGDMEIPFQIKHEKVETVGIMLFLDGIQQPFKIVGESEEYEYMHVFNLEGVEKDEEYIFTASFVPVTGQKGETLELTAIAASKPYFQPDLVNVFGYTMNVADNFLCPTRLISFEDTPDTPAYEPNDSGVTAYDLTVTQENLTEETKNEYYVDLNGVYQDPGYSPDAIADDHTAYEQLFINGESELYFQTKHIGDSETVHITYKTYGAPGYQFAACFFVNNLPVDFGGELSRVEAELESNKITVIEFDLKTSELWDKTSFYALCVSRNGHLEFDTSEYSLNTDFSNKILLYKEYVEGVN